MSIRLTAGAIVVGAAMAWGCGQSTPPPSNPAPAPAAATPAPPPPDTTPAQLPVPEAQEGAISSSNATSGVKGPFFPTSGSCRRPTRIAGPSSN